MLCMGDQLLYHQDRVWLPPTPEGRQHPFPVTVSYEAYWKEAACIHENPDTEGVYVCQSSLEIQNQ